MSPPVGQLHEAPMPIVDLDDPAAAQAVRRACIDHGFFYVINHGVDQALVQQQFQQSRAFFSLAEEEKNKVATVENNARGYTSMSYQTLDPAHSTTPDTCEGFWAWSPDVAAGTPEADLPYAGPNAWPSTDLLPDFRRVCVDYMDATVRLSNRVRKLVAEALQLPPDFFEQYFTRPLHQLRLLHYAGIKSSVEKGVYGCGAHSDWGFITFLTDDGNPGLQLEYKGNWLDVRPVPNSYIVNLGDMLEFWSNGIFKSTRHRVVKPEPDRYSCVLFVSPDHDAVIDGLPTCPRNESEYDKKTVSEYLSMRYKRMQDEQPAANPMES